MKAGRKLPQGAQESMPDQPKKQQGTCANSDGSIPVLSFFTGAGLLDLGFLRHGFDPVWTNEVSQEFADAHDHAYSKMFGSDTHRIKCRESITDTEPKTILSEAFGAEGSPALFGVIGGPPCPDFSMMGLHRGQDGKNGVLSQVFVSRILALQPTFFVFENVPGLVRIKKHRAFFDTLRTQLAQDYYLDWSLLNALDYGVPQDRRRLFLVGLKKSWAAGSLEAEALRMAQKASFCEPRQWFPWPVPKFMDAVHSHDWPEQVETYGDTPNKPRGIPEALMTGPHLLGCELEALPNGKDFFKPHSNRFREVPEGQDCNKSFKRLHRWRYSPTVAYGNNEVHLHPTEPRRLTVREVMVLQSVPNEYELPENMPLCHKFKTIANGVPVALAAEVATSLKGVLLATPAAASAPATTGSLATSA